MIGYCTMRIKPSPAKNGVAAQRKAFFQCFKLCLKLFYQMRKTSSWEKWRCRFAAGGVSRRQAFFQCFKLCLKLFYQMRKTSSWEKWRCRFAAGGVSRRQAFFQCFKLCLKLFYHAGGFWATRYFYKSFVFGPNSGKIEAELKKEAFQCNSRLHTIT